MAIILAWLRLSTRSVWSSSLAHAGTNMVLATLSTALLVGGAKIDWAVNDLLQSVPLAAICAWRSSSADNFEPTGFPINDPPRRTVSRLFRARHSDPPPHASWALLGPDHSQTRPFL